MHTPLLGDFCVVACTHRLKCDVDREQAANMQSSDAMDEDEDDDKHELRGIFWMTPEQVEEARRYHHVMIHDNTYKCNVFGLSLGLFTSINKHGHTTLTAQNLIDGETTEDYVWSYTCYVQACDRAPRVVLTDRDPAVEAVITISFPSTAYHFWCVA
jgi:hypothetical protein